MRALSPMAAPVALPPMAMPRALTLRRAARGGVPPDPLLFRFPMRTRPSGEGPLAAPAERGVVGVAADGDAAGPRALRSWLEGGVEARPANVRLAVTSNRRAIVPRHAAEQEDPLNPRDAVDDLQALADRFGLSVGFHAASQDDYLAMVAAHAEPLRLAWDQGAALEWARRRGARSGRTAWQFVTELAGRAGRPA